MNKTEIAIDRLKMFEPKDGYFVAYSGGKDSEVILDLVKKSGVKYDAHYHVTSVDAPETIYFIRREHPEVIWDFPIDKKTGKVITMWSLIVKKKIPPTRIIRYCCEYLKESHGKGRITITGVRWAESSNRRKNRGLVDMGTRKSNSVILNEDNDEARRMVEQCYRTKKTMLNPIVDWTDEEVWAYIKENNLQINPLYKKGHKRVGCIGCPMNYHAPEELNEYPQIKRLYLRAFDKMLKQVDPKKITDWKTAQDVMDWWLSKR